MHPSSHPPLQWSLHALADLAPAALYEALRLRVDVFVVEQACAYRELDGKDLDSAARHLFGRDAAGALLAYCRLLPPGLSFDTPAIGRIVVAAGARGRGYADELMREALAHCARLWPGRTLTMGAQQHLAGFYGRHGFEVVGGMYLEDGIPHVDMRREVAAGAG